MTNIKNIITLKRAVILVLLTSLATNAYFFSTRWLTKERTKYYNSGVMYVFQKGLELGKVSFTSDKGQKIELILPNQCQQEKSGE